MPCIGRIYIIARGCAYYLDAKITINFDTRFPRSDCRITISRSDFQKFHTTIARTAVENVNLT